MTERDRELARRLDYVINRYISSATDIRKTFGFKSDAVFANLRNVKHSSTLNQLHMDGLEKYFDIPLSVWEEVPMTDEEIDENIRKYRLNKDQNKIHEEHNKRIENIFQPNLKLFEKLTGEWYGYLYASNPQSASESEGIWIVPTTINENYSVVDYWNNKGYLLIGKHESLIIKESYDNDDLTVIRFSNRQVPSQHMRFVIVSNQNNTIHEMVNFGFYSRVKYTPQEAKEILGNIDKVQLKLDLDFNDRLNQLAIVPN